MAPKVLPNVWTRSSCDAMGKNLEFVVLSSGFLAKYESKVNAKIVTVKKKTMTNVDAYV
jgi:hypothetical protein